MNKFFKGLALWLLIILGAWYLTMITGKQQPVYELSYSTFKKFIREGKVTSVIIKGPYIHGTYQDKGKAVTYKTNAMTDPTLITELQQYNVADFRAEEEKTWWTNMFWYFGPVILLVLLWFMVMRQMQGGAKQAMSFGRSKARLQSGRKDKVTFADVAGCDECKEELQEIIEFLKDPKRFQRLGGKIPKGVLLYGAPGTGKTLLAKAVAGEAAVPFFSSSGSEFVEMFVGVGASRVRDLFDKGRKNAPCLLFVDEIDAVGRHRFAGIGGGHDEREQTLNQLLVEMDGFDTKEGVILIAATNRPDVLDPALLRPGRFDRHIAVPNPDIKGREDILKVHTRAITLGNDVNLNVVARRTPGFVGADLANLCNEAALLGARHNKEAVNMKEMEESIERLMAGPERKARVMPEKEKRMVAYHEAGHAFVAKCVPHADPVHKVSIIPRGPALGYTLQLPTEDRYLTTKQELMAKLVVLLGGRAAEVTFFNDVTTGAHNDIARATDMAQKMICEYGMNTKLGPLAYRKPEAEIFLGRDISRDRAFSNETLEAIDSEIKSLVEQAYTQARGYIEEHKEVMLAIVEQLLEKEVLSAEEFTAILHSKGIESKDESHEQTTETV